MTAFARSPGAAVTAFARSPGAAVIPFAEATGVVAAFDEPRGLGMVRADGGGEVPFHCTAIADGTRTIPVGEAVRFRLVPGHLGRWEADALAPVGTAS